MTGGNSDHRSLRDKESFLQQDRKGCMLSLHVIPSTSSKPNPYLAQCFHIILIKPPFQMSQVVWHYTNPTFKKVSKVTYQESEEEPKRILQTDDY